MGPKGLLGCLFTPGRITGEVLVPELVQVAGEPFFQLICWQIPQLCRVQPGGSSGFFFSFFAILQEAASPWVVAEDSSPNQLQKVNYFSGIWLEWLCPQKNPIGGFSVVESNPKMRWTLGSPSSSTVFTTECWNETLLRCVQITWPPPSG